MYTKILVPLDGSTRAEAILPHVEELAKKFGSTLVLVQVVDPATALVGIDGMTIDLNQRLIDEEVADARSYLQSLQANLHSQGITSRTLVPFGSVVQALLDIAEAENVDLIALASHGRTGLARIFYGSVAAGLIQSVDRPILLIRAKH